jgi:hypothetical protein
VGAAAPLPATAAARRRVAEWITFWARHLETKGVRAEQLALLLLDEPGTPAQVEVITSWAAAIEAAEPRVRIFNDPVYRDAAQTPLELLRASDVMSPNRTLWLRQPRVHEQVFLPHRSATRALAFYSCLGPVRQLDPYSYHRLQAWDVWRQGGVLSSFWSFSDGGGGSSWNELLATRTSYAPQFLDPVLGCTTSKHMEAIREGQLDFEYLAMLRRRLDSTTPGSSSSFGVRARALLDGAAARVLAAESSDTMWWRTDKDRGLADRVRNEILETLEMR